MRLIYMFFIAVNLIAVQPCLADCPFIKDVSPTIDTGYPVTLSFPASVLKVDADAPAGTMIGTLILNTSAIHEIYYDCRNQQNYTYGKVLDATGLRYIGENRYAISDTGVSLLPAIMTPGGTGFFPTPSVSNTLPRPLNQNYYVTSNSTVFTLTFFKIGDSLNLKNPLAGDILLKSTPDFIHQWINSDTPGDNRPITINLDGVTIVSTPVCKTDNAVINVPFGAVTQTTLINGLKHDLKFTVTCRTDFGAFDAKASITATERTSDNKYIVVSDADGNTDRLKIGISDSKNNMMNVDGSSSESIANINNNQPAKFNWSATLLRDSQTLLPKVGDFTAQAEITIQIN